MDWFYYLFLLGFLLAAIDDYRRQKIHNLIPASLWVLAGLSGQPWALPGLVLSFGVLFLANTLFTMRYGSPFFQWGDILLLPMFIFSVCFIRNKAIVLPFILVGCASPLLMSFLKKKRIAVAPLVFAFYLMAGIAYVIN